jgi:hypothetical protein
MCNEKGEARSLPFHCCMRCAYLPFSCARTSPPGFFALWTFT